MGIRYHMNGWEVKVYDPDLKRLRYVGRFPTEQEARDYFERLTADRENARRCPGCRKLFLPADEWQKRCSPRCEANVKKRERRVAQRRADDHWTYTCIDANGEVVYVGMTSTGIRRHREHGRDAVWWKDVAAIRIEHFATREEALRAEAEGIARHKPRFNVLLNPESVEAA